MKGINHLLSGKTIKDSKIDNILEYIPQYKLEQYYSEICKVNSFVYFFGGIDIQTGEISDLIVGIDLLNLDFRLEIKMPKKLFAFSITKSYNTGNYYIVGGLTNEMDIILKNESIFEVSFKEKGRNKYLKKEINFKEIGKTSLKKIRPVLTIDDDNLFIFSGEKKISLEIFNLTNSTLTTISQTHSLNDQNININHNQLASFIIKA